MLEKERLIDSVKPPVCALCVFFCMFVPGVRSWLKLFGKTGSRFEGRSISDNSCPSPDLLRSFLMSLTARLLISSLHWSPGECVQNMYRLKKKPKIITWLHIWTPTKRWSLRSSMTYSTLLHVHSHTGVKLQEAMSGLVDTWANQTCGLSGKGWPLYLHYPFLLILTAFNQEDNRDVVSQ